MKDRVILHCDCNSFFASVETALDPSYANVPMAVCGNPELRHGIVLAKNELAKAYGIQTAETVYSARRKCPQLVIAPPHYHAYSEYSKRVNAIYADYTDKIEQFGIDESWLDVTDSQRLFGNGLQIAEIIRNRVKNEIGITVSIGVSYNKVFAKLGSDYKKPDAITVIDRDSFERIVSPLPCSDLLFVGKKTAQALSRIGIHTIGELSTIPLEFLIDKFGKIGNMLYKYSRGLDDSPVDPAEKDSVKSVGNSYTFKRDLLTVDEIRLGVNFLTEEIARRLRQKQLKAGTVSVTLKDPDLHSIQRQAPLDSLTDISSELSSAAMDILLREWTEGQPVRMIAVSASGLVSADNEYTQIGLFDDSEMSLRRQRSKDKEKTIDMIREKHGSLSIVRGSYLGNDIGISSQKNKG